MNHAEEQEMELQALEAIYGDDFKKDEDGGGGLRDPSKPIMGSGWRGGGVFARGM